MPKVIGSLALFAGQALVWTGKRRKIGLRDPAFRSCGVGYGRRGPGERGFRGDGGLADRVDGSGGGCWDIRGYGGGFVRWVRLRRFNWFGFFGFGLKIGLV